MRRRGVLSLAPKQAGARPPPPPFGRSPLPASTHKRGRIVRRRQRDRLEAHSVSTNALSVPNGRRRKRGSRLRSSNCRPAMTAIVSKARTRTARRRFENCDEREEKAQHRHGRLRLHGPHPLQRLRQRQSVFRAGLPAGPQGGLRPQPGGRRRFCGKLGLRSLRDRLARSGLAARTSTSSTSPAPTTRMPRSRSPPRKRARW